MVRRLRVHLAVAGPTTAAVIEPASRDAGTTAAARAATAATARRLCAVREADRPPAGSATRARRLATRGVCLRTP